MSNPETSFAASAEVLAQRLTAAKPYLDSFLEIEITPDPAHDIQADIADLPSHVRLGLTDAARRLQVSLAALPFAVQADFNLTFSVENDTLDVDDALLLTFNDAQEWWIPFVDLVDSLNCLAARLDNIAHICPPSGKMHDFRITDRSDQVTTLRASCPRQAARLYAAFESQTRSLDSQLSEIECIARLHPRTDWL